MTIIPAIDIIDGKCVRLTNGDYAQQVVYGNDPVAVAKIFEAAGLQRLHLVDLDGAKAGKLVNLPVLEAIASQTKLTIDFGGGIKTMADVQAVFNAGASIITIGSLAVKQPELLGEWVQTFGTTKFLVGADVRNEQIQVSGWLEDGGIDIFSFLSRMEALRITDIFCTDISKDGALQGPAIELYKKILQEFPGVNLIASGGVSSISDVEALQAIGCKSVIIGKAIYENKVPLNPLKGTYEAYKFFISF